MCEYQRQFEFHFLISVSNVWKPCCIEVAVNRIVGSGPTPSILISALTYIEFTLLISCSNIKFPITFGCKGRKWTWACGWIMKCGGCAKVFGKEGCEGFGPWKDGGCEGLGPWKEGGCAGFGVWKERCCEGLLE